MKSLIAGLTIADGPAVEGACVDTVREYMEAQVLTASPHRLHLMVIDGAIKFARWGLQALENEDWETLELALSRSRDCVAELISGLRESESTDLIDSLKAMFAYCYRSLSLADPQRNPKLIEDAIHVLDLHRATWLELGEKLAQENNNPNVPTPHARSWTT